MKEIHTTKTEYGQNRDINFHNVYKVKYIIFLAILLNSLPGITQKLENSEWIKLKSERKDGSRIISRFILENQFNKLTFGSNDTLLSLSKGFLDKLPYKINKDTLVINGFNKNVIEILNDSMLVYSEYTKSNEPLDKFDRHFYMKKRYSYDYALKNGLVEFITDSLIKVNNYAEPEFTKGDINEYFSDKVKKIVNKKYVTGYFIISPESKVIKVYISHTSKAGKELKDRIKTLITETSGMWNLPFKDSNYSYKYLFTIRFFNQYEFKSISFVPHKNKEHLYDIKKQFTLNDKRKAERYYYKATRLLLKTKFNKAIKWYSKCIEIDSLYIDAYYNRAYANYQLNDTIKSCKDWSILLNYGQKEGERLYEQNCK